MRKRLLAFVPIAALVFGVFTSAQAEEDPAPVQIEGKAVNSSVFSVRCDSDAAPLGQALTAGTTTGGQNELNYDLFKFTVEPGTTTQLTMMGVANPPPSFPNTLNIIATLEQQPDGTTKCTRVWRGTVDLMSQSPVLGPGEYWYIVGNSSWDTEYSAVTHTSEA